MFLKSFRPRKASVPTGIEGRAGMLKQPEPFRMKF